jgi:hypothetical protein
VNYLFEPGRFRVPRGTREAAHVAPEAVRDRLYPPAIPWRVFLTHTRPEALLGVIHPVCTGPLTVGLGFTNHGGTLDTGGMLVVNGVTWAPCAGRGRAPAGDGSRGAADGGGAGGARPPRLAPGGAGLRRGR